MPTSSGGFDELIIDGRWQIIGKLAAHLLAAGMFLVDNATAVRFEIGRPAKPRAAVEGINFYLMRVDDDRFGFYDQHDADDIELGAAMQD